VEVFFKDDTGERIVLENPGPGEVFGEISFLDGGGRTASVLAVEDLHALTVDLLRHTASRNVNAEVEDRRSQVEKVADWIAAFSGSLTFLNLHLLFFAVWILLNVNWLPGWKPPLFDP